MRDNFSLNVKRILASRAGHKCSVCLKSTSGPGSDNDVAISDGIAAHITAASANGPRFDPSLSPEERRSPENGIWACTQHGREIDTDMFAFSVTVLRGLKRIREDSAAREIQQRGHVEDQSGLLIELPYVTTNYKLFEVMVPQTYTFSTTSVLRDILRNAESPSRLLDLAPEVIIGTWDTHPNVAGILSTLLSNNIDYWKPMPIILKKLERLCEAVITTDNWTRVALVEPLAFALAAQGCPDVHRKLLERLVEDTKWRDKDAARIRDYYGGIGTEIAAIFRHWRDPFRKGLLPANDVARFIDLLLSTDATLTRPYVRQSLLELLQEHAKVLFESGAFDLAQSVNEFLEAFQTIKDKKSSK